MLDECVAAQPVEITALARENIRAQRARLGLTQASVARRMNQLGYHWYPQTCGLVERNKRPLLADELAALALCLDTRPDVLILPPPGDMRPVTFGEQQIGAQRLWSDDGSVTWDGDDLKIGPPAVQYRPVDLALAREPDPQVRAGIRAFADEQRRDDAPELAPMQPGDEGAMDLPAGHRPPKPPDE